MDDHKCTFRIETMCKVLAVSRSGYYAWCNRLDSARDKEDKRLGVAIEVNFKRSRETYGYRRLYQDLKAQGEYCGKHRVAKIMRKLGIKPKMQKKFKLTTNSNHTKPIHSNYLQREFYASKPNEKWVADITYLPTKEGWLYLSVLMDLYSRKIVGWSMSPRLQDSLTTDALKMALVKSKSHSPLLIHSDRGSQYASSNYQAMLRQHGIHCSMSRAGECYDNAAMESFFHTLKTECTDHYHFSTREDARRTVFEYIEVFYNRQRRHSYLNYQSPAEFELKNKAA